MNSKYNDRVVRLAVLSLGLAAKPPAASASNSGDG